MRHVLPDGGYGLDDLAVSLRVYSQLSRSVSREDMKGFFTNVAGKSRRSASFHTVIFERPALHGLKTVEGLRGASSCSPYIKGAPAGQRVSALQLSWLHF
jgi:hypothetical protein